MTSAHILRADSGLPQRVPQPIASYSGPQGLAWMSLLRAVLAGLRDWQPGGRAALTATDRDRAALAANIPAVQPGICRGSLNGEEHA